MPNELEYYKAAQYSDDTQLLLSFSLNTCHETIIKHNKDVENLVKLSCDHGLQVNS